MSQPLVSVIVPCFNVAETVEETIASISAQTIGDFEIIAVDNNCTDATRRILRRVQIRDPRLRIIEQHVPGASAARNAGIRAANGELIAFLDADDLWDPTYLAEHLAHLDDPSISISYSRIRRIDAAGQSTGFFTQPKQSVSAPELLRSNPCTVMFVARAEVFERSGLFDETLGAAEDQELLFRAAAQGMKICGIAKVLASYRIMPGGLSSDLPNMVSNHDKLLRAAMRIAPELTARHQRVARAAMLRYCARRAIEQQEPAAVAWQHLKKMYLTAPDLIWREPGPTIKVSVRTLLALLFAANFRTGHPKRSPKEV